MAPAPDPVSISLNDGVVLDGELWLPSGATPDAPVPGVVMSHGFSALRSMALPAFAAVFADAGLAVCLYDHRNLGPSGGEPRQRIDPWQQTLDMVEVVTWLGARPEVDADRLGAWGSSFSGGEVMVLGAMDRRIRAVVANAPFAGLGDLDPDDGEAADARHRAMAAVFAGTAPVPDRSPIGPIAVVSEPGSGVPAIMSQPEAWTWFSAAAEGTSWQNEITLVTSADPPFDPFACAAHVAPAALLMVVATHDDVAATSVALAAHERAREPRQLEVFEGDHFSDYDGPVRDHVATVMRDFLLAHL